MNLKFAATSRPGHHAEVVEWVQAAESLGYHRIGIADSPALYRELWVSLTHVALNTRRLPFGVVGDEPGHAPSRGNGERGVGPGRNNPRPRLHRRWLRQQWRLQRRSTRRHPRNPPRVRDHPTQAAHNGRGSVRRRNRSPPLGPTRDKKIPIYMAAHARGALRLAGEIADGVVIGTGTTPEVVKASLETLAEGARKSGRDPNEIDVWWSVPFNLRDSDDGKLDPQGGPAREANYLNRFTLKGKFVPRRYWEGIRALAAAYDLSTHGRPTPEQLYTYDMLAEEYGVREYLLERFGGISGTPEQCIEKLRRNAAIGVRQYSINVPDENRPQRLRRMMEEVISHV